MGLLLFRKKKKRKGPPQYNVECERCGRRVTVLVHPVTGETKWQCPKCGAYCRTTVDLSLWYGE